MKIKISSLHFSINDIAAFLYASTLFEIWGTFRVLIEVLCIGFFFLYRVRERKSLKLDISNPFYLWSFSFLLLCVASVLYTDFQNSALLGVRMYLETFLAGTAISFYITSSDKLVKVLKFIVYSAVVYFVKILLTVPISDMLSRRFATGLNANTVGMKLALCLTIVIWMYKENVINIRRLALLFILLSPMIIVTGSKKALFVLVFSVLFILLMYQPNVIRIIMYLAVALAAVCIVYYMIMNNEVLYSIIGYRVEGLIKVFEYGVDSGDLSTRGRIRLIEIGLNKWKEKPIWGFGINTYAIGNQIMGFGGRFLYSHCNYIELLYGLGIVGTIAYYRIFLKLFFRQIKGVRESRFFKLFLTLCTTVVILDIGMVSYLDEFTQAIIVLSCTVCTIGLKTERNIIENKVGY